MKQTIILLLMLIMSYSVWAQKTDSPNKKSLKPIVIEGNVENVADGTIILLFNRNKPFMSYSYELSDTVKEGKFRIVHNPKNDDEEYVLRIATNHYGLNFYASPGSTTKVMGKGADIESWRVINDNPMQKIANDYRAYLDLKVPDYYEIRKKRDWMDQDDDEYPNVLKAYDDAQVKYAECMLEYLSDKPFNSVLLKQLCWAACHAYITNNENMKERIRQLLPKIPADCSDDEGTDLADIKHFIVSKPKSLTIGDKMVDFLLYDHAGNEHHLTEFNDNGKYLLLEFNSRTCQGCMEHRQYDALNGLYNNHSDKVDIVMVNCDEPYFWKLQCKNAKKWGRDPWNEWNDMKSCDDVKQRYGSISGPSYFFISPDGTILGRISDKENLQKAIQKYFDLANIENKN